MNWNKNGTILQLTILELGQKSSLGSGFTLLSADGAMMSDLA